MSKRPKPTQKAAPGATPAPAARAKPDLEVLFPEVEVERFRVRPLTPRQAVRCVQRMARISAALVAAGIEIAEIDLHDRDAMVLHLARMPAVLESVSEDLFAMLAEATGTTVDDIGDGVPLQLLELMTLVFVSQNSRLLGKYLAPLAAMYRMAPAPVGQTTTAG